LKRNSRQDDRIEPAAAPTSGSSAQAGPRQGLLRIGRVTGLHGLAGALRVRPDNPDTEAFDRIQRVYLEINQTVGEYKIVAVRKINRSTLKIGFEGVVGADAAERLRGARVLVATSDLPPTGPGEFYYFQVIGCEVSTTDGLRLGTIAEVFSTGANDVWIVRDAATEVLVPVIADVVKTMDLEARKITIEAVPGLLG
jgi:16S rRNA processing protein RimM